MSHRSASGCAFLLLGRAHYLRAPAVRSRPKWSNSCSHFYIRLYRKVWADPGYSEPRDLASTDGHGPIVAFFRLDERSIYLGSGVTFAGGCADGDRNRLHALLSQVARRYR